MPKLTLLAILISGFLTASARDLPDTLKDNSLLYQGTEYVNQYGGIIGDPFFPTDQNKGSVLYNGNWYSNLDMLYDCRDDILVVENFQELLKLQLVKEKLQEFYLDGHHFIKLALDNAQGRFYEQVYSGRRMVLVQWHKAMVTDHSHSGEYFTLKSSVIVLQDGKPILLQSASDLFNLDKAHQRELRKMYRDGDYSFKNDAIKATQAVITQMEANGW